MSMFCFQCQETAENESCLIKGICGKDEVTAGLQDLLTHVAQGVAQLAERNRRDEPPSDEVGRFVVEALFTTVTNVNFDPDRLQEWIGRGLALRDHLRKLQTVRAKQAGRPLGELTGPAAFEPAGDLDGLLAQARELSIERRRERLGADVAGLQELVLYGLKGAAAYYDHAWVLGQRDEETTAEFLRILAYLAEDPTDAKALLAESMKVGELNYKVMELLDHGHTVTFGAPEPTVVRMSPVAGKAILVSGHDLDDLRALLEQTQGLGVNVYTHGEMLPAHGYPELKKFPHLVGNYGGAWQDQRREFAAFPGAILMTTNCIQQPKPEYQGRIFTSGLVAWPEVTHLDRGMHGGRDYSPVISAALAAPGFVEDAPEKTTLVGFGHQATLSVADQVIDAVKSGGVRRFFLVGGCDGRSASRDYYRQLARQIPDDCVILTLGCGKFRFNDLDFGQVGGLPRLLDMGQCNDAYSAIRVAAALADAFECGVNDLPLSLVLSWYEQKAVAVLLTLLSLGVRDIRVGPTLPAFLTPAAVQTLVEQFGLAPIASPEADLQAMLG